MERAADGHALTFDELDVGLRVAESLRAVAICVLARDLELLGRHIYADDGTLFSNQRCSCVAIATRSTAQIQDSAILNAKGKWSTTAIEFFANLGRDALDYVLDYRMRS